jgi:transposase
MARKRRTFSREFKLEAVRLLVEGGMTVSQVAEDLGISRNSLVRWKAELTASSGAFPGKGRRRPDEEEMDRLRRRVKQLEQERDFLRKAAAYFAKEPK